MNDERIDVRNITTEFTNEQIENLILKPGINVMTLDSDKFMKVGDTHITFAVATISITNYP